MLVSKSLSLCRCKYITKQTNKYSTYHDDLTIVLGVVKVKFYARCNYISHPSNPSTVTQQLQQPSSPTVQGRGLSACWQTAISICPRLQGRWRQSVPVSVWIRWCSTSQHGWPVWRHCGSIGWTGWTSLDSLPSAGQLTCPSQPR